MPTANSHHITNHAPANSARLPLSLQCACRRHGIPPTRFVILVWIESQTALLFEQSRYRPGIEAPGSVPGTGVFFPGYSLLKRYRCSTSKFGIGQEENTNRTPLGLHRVTEKIGGGWPVGTVFRGRRMAGYTWQGLPGAPITNRILWLDGLEPGFNRGGKVDSHARYIYIHGTGDEPGLGRPASHGCIQLSGDDLLPLFDRLPVGTLVWIGRWWRNALVPAHFIG